MSLRYFHVDVFSETPYGGNSLAVFPDARGLRGAQMLQITQELRHFESIFLEPTAHGDTVRARVFDLLEELPFAGHPLLGAAAVLHHCGQHAETCTWKLVLSDRVVEITTERRGRGYSGTLDQGAPRFHGAVDERARFAHAFTLDVEDLDPNLPLEVVDTGLPYLIIPVGASALARARIRQNLTDLLQRVQAQFAVLFDAAAGEVRHWNNDGILEDSATGSAAGTIGAYCLRHGLVRGGEPFLLKQGRFTGRPSVISVQADGDPDVIARISVGGSVIVVGRGELDMLPSDTQR
jgi:PhzF family phenazine biosynthesis protein